MKNPYPIFLVRVKGNVRDAINAAASRGIPCIPMTKEPNTLYADIAVTCSHQERLIRWTCEPSLQFAERGYAIGTVCGFEVPGEPNPGAMYRDLVALGAGEVAA